MPEYEYQQLRKVDPERAPAPKVDVEPDQAAVEEFVAGLHMMSSDFDRLVFNFAQCAAILAGEPDAPERLRGMMEFAFAYHGWGLERAMDAIGENSGVPVEIVSGIDGKPRRLTPGRIIGLVGAEGGLKYRSFNGIAVIEGLKGRSRFVAVSIDPEDGLTQIHRDQYDFNNPDLLSDKPVDEIFPPIPEDLR